MWMIQQSPTRIRNGEGWFYFYIKLICAEEMIRKIMNEKSGNIVAVSLKIKTWCFKSEVYF